MQLRYFGRNMRQEIQLRKWNVLSKPVIVYSSEMCMPRSQEQNRSIPDEVSDVSIRSYLGEEIRNEETKKLLGN